jgi:amino acid permease
MDIIIQGKIKVDVNTDKLMSVEESRNRNNSITAIAVIIAGLIIGGTLGLDKGTKILGIATISSFCFASAVVFLIILIHTINKKTKEE